MDGGLELEWDLSEQNCEPFSGLCVGGPCLMHLTLIYLGRLVYPPIQPETHVIVVTMKPGSMRC